MKHGSWSTLAALILGVGLTPLHAHDPVEHFHQRVQPLLAARCLNCHGSEQQKGSLRLDSREATLRGGDLGPAVVPGKPSESLLAQAVAHHSPDLAMPPKDKLAPADIEVFERWILDGAPWPDATSTGGSNATPSVSASSVRRLGDAWSDPENPIVRIFQGQRLDLWSLQPVRLPAIPPSRTFAPAESHESSRAAGVTADANPIDRFIRDTLAEQRLSPAPEADRRTLVRRLYLDLLGLPPDPAEVDRWVRDTSSDAVGRLVDQLLADPRWGEHQARQWLDVVRYSDSNGFDWDEFRPEAWRYRDYVVRSFNADKPFVQFIREQLAGDELLDGPPRTAAEQDLLIATGYLRIGPQDNSASLFNEQSRARAEWMADLTETTGSAFLGITLSCCRCHDHKFDPLSQADHFRLRAFFEPLKYGDDLTLDLAPEKEAIDRQHAEVDARIQPLKEEQEALIRRVRLRVRSDRVAKLTDDERRVLAMADDPQPQDFKEQVAALEKKIAATDVEILAAATQDETEQHRSLGKRIEALAATKRARTRGLLATDTTETVRATHILFQGDHTAERAPVVPGFLSILDPNPAEIRPPVNPRTTGRRLALADWIASPTNPLTARVLVNRVWQGLFGNGLVLTPNDFGLAGARPSHPQLLDWLASEFLAGGGSIKRLIRLITDSATYRQSSLHPDATRAHRVDSENRLLWRQNLRRVSAEQLRDSLLHVSGLLQSRSGGPPAWPLLPPEILQANPAFLDDNAEKTKGWYPSPPDQRWVRSVYLVQKRTVRLPFMETFDQPENSGSCPVRTTSIVAPQALSLLNGDEPIQAAQALARRVASEAGRSIDAQVERAFRLALQRPPESSERQACARFVRLHGLPALCRALVNLNEFVYRD